MKKIVLTLVIMFSFLFGLEVSGVYKPDLSKIYYLSSVALFSNNSTILLSYNNNAKGIVSYSPEKEAVLSDLELNVTIRDIKIIADTAYIATSAANDKTSLFVVDISDENDLKIIKKIIPYESDYMEDAYHLSVSSDQKVLAVSLYHTGVVLYDISDPKNPIKKSFVQNDYGYGLIALGDGYLSVLNDNNTNEPDSCIYDVSDISNPKKIQTFRAGTSVKDALIYNNKLFITDNFDHVLQIYSFNNDKATNDFNITFENQPISLTHYNDILYVTLGEGGYEEKPKIAEIDTINNKIIQELNVTDSYVELNSINISNDGKKIVTIDDGTIYLISNDNTTEQDEEKTYSLKSGWNLVGILQTINTADLPTDIKVVWRYDNKEWKLYQTLNTKDNYGHSKLTQLYSGEGVWIYADKDTLISNDTKITSYELPISKGWQTLSALSDINMTMFDDKHIASLWCYHNGWYTYLPNNDSLMQNLPQNIKKLQEIKKGDGFWVNALESGLLDIKDSDTSTFSGDYDLNNLSTKDFTLSDIADKSFIIYDDVNDSIESFILSFDSNGVGTVNMPDGTYTLKYNNGSIDIFDKENNLLTYFKKLESSDKGIIVAGFDLDEDSTIKEVFIDGWFTQDLSDTPDSITFPYTCYILDQDSYNKLYLDQNILTRYSYDLKSKELTTQKQSFYTNNNKIVFEYPQEFTLNDITYQIIGRTTMYKISQISDFDIFKNITEIETNFKDENLKDGWSDIINNKKTVFIYQFLDNGKVLDVTDDDFNATYTINNNIATIYINKCEDECSQSIKTIDIQSDGTVNIKSSQEEMSIGKTSNLL